MIAANVGAAKMGFFTTPDGSGSPLADGTDRHRRIFQEATPGHFSVLPEGTTFNSFDPNYPHEQFGAFVKASLRGIASGVNVSYNSLANDLEGVNYSSLRAGVLEERDSWMTLQNWLTESLLEPLFADWLTAALLAGTVRTVRGAPITVDKFEKFNVPQWQGRRWQWVDPLKDVEANIAAINAGLKSRREVIAEQGATSRVRKTSRRNRRRRKNWGLCSRTSTVPRGPPRQERRTMADEKKDLFRDAQFERESADAEARTVELAFASELPVERWGYREILDCAPSSVRLERLKDGGALLVDHEWTDQVGVVESVSFGADRKGRAVVRFGKSQRASEIFNDVVDGIRTKVSFGYWIHKFESTKAADGSKRSARRFGSRSRFPWLRCPPITRSE